MLEIYNFNVFTAPCELWLYCNDKQKSDNCAKEILGEMKRLEKKFNYFDSASYLSHLNQRKEQILDLETKNILTLAKHYYTLTESTFDITIATIKTKYTQEERDEFMKYVGCEHFIIKKDKLYFDNIYTKIDLGGFVKEYGIDKSIKIIKRHKITSALINFGGDIFAYGTKPNKEKFKIGIKNPLNKEKTLFSVHLENEALTTSASYERYTQIGDKCYSHIINKSNTEDMKQILSATVVSKNAVETGIWSTTLMIKPNIKTKQKKYLIDNNLKIIS